MADIFAPNGREPIIPSPMLQAKVIPNIDAQIPNGLGIVSAWGAGSSVRRYVPQGVELNAPPTFDQVVQAPLNFQLLNFNFEGLIGPPGPPGPPGPTGLGNLSPYQTADKSTPTTPAAAGVLDASLPLITDGCVFSDAGANKVAWTAGTILWAGTEYAIAADAAGTTNVYIYWDSGSPNVFSTTSTAATATGLTKWIMCINDGAGTPYPAFQNKIIHGGIIQATTITAALMAANSITAANGAIANLAVVSGKIANLSVDTLQIAGSAIETDKVLTAATTVSAYDDGGDTELDTPDWRTCATATMTTVGGAVVINFSGYLDMVSIEVRSVDIEVVGPSGTIWKNTEASVGSSTDRGVSVACSDQPAAGSRTYYIRARHSAAGGDVEMYMRKGRLTIEETKK